MKRTKLCVEAVLMDLDGTLVDSRSAYVEAAKVAFAEIGVRSFDRAIVLEIPRRLEKNCKIDDLIAGIDAAKFLDRYLWAYYQATKTKTELIPGISETVKMLSQRFKLAVITMRFAEKKEVIEELKRHRLAEYFQEVITGLDVRNSKPSPEAIMKCAEDFGVALSKCMFVGDSVSDIRCGKAARANTAAVLSGIFSHDELKAENPDLILKSARELPYFLE